MRRRGRWCFFDVKEEVDEEEKVDEEEVKTLWTGEG